MVLSSQPRDPLGAVECVVARFRPYLGVDGCVVVILEATPELVVLRLEGAMIGCPMAQAAIAAGLDAALREAVPTLREVRVLSATPPRDPPAPTG